MRSSIILSKRKRKVLGSASSTSTHSVKFLKRKRKVIGPDSPSQQIVDLSKRQRKVGSSNFGCYNPDDRISPLPDDIILLILSFLTIQEAAATSFLSTRWRYLWASVPRLDFNALFFPVRLPISLPVRLTYKYVRRVSKVVRLYKGNSLEEFRLQLGLTKKHKRFVDWCVKFALSKQVKKLELNFNYPHEICNYNSYKKHLYTFGVRALNQSTPHGSTTPVYRWSLSQFKSLTSLCLRSVSICGDVLDGILLNCPVLEMLTLQHVIDLEYVKVVGPSLRLKHLEIEQCKELTKIELYDASIVSFKRFGFEGDLFMRNLPHLVDLSLSTFLKLANEFHAFSSYLVQLQCLSIIVYDMPLNDEEIQPIYKLSNLLELEIAHSVELDDDLLRLLPIIEGSPYLRKIVIRVLHGMSLEERTLEERKSRKVVKVKSCLGLEHLKVLKLAGYRGGANEDEFISCIIENAAALHTIIIDPNYQPYWPSLYAAFGSWKPIHEVEDYVRRHAKEWLEGIIPANIQLIIV